MSSKRKKQHKIITILLVIGIIAALVIVTGLLAIMHVQSRVSMTQISNVNLNLAQIDSLLPGGPPYATALSNNVTRIAGQLRTSGYLAVSASEFYQDPISNFSYPTVITSTVYLFSNDSAAQLFSNGLAYTGGEVSEPGRIFTNRTSVRYQYNEKIINITIVPSVAVLNQSFLNPQTSLLPIYQYTAYFTYKNAAGVVSTSGYYENSVIHAYLLAESLARNLINSAA